MKSIDEKFSDVLSLGFKITLQDGRILSRNRETHTYLIEEDGDLYDISWSEIKKILSELRYWKTKSGEMYEVNEMKTPHIRNTMNHINNMLSSENISEAQENYFKLYLNIFKQILRERDINTLLVDDDIGIDIL